MNVLVVLVYVAAVAAVALLVVRAVRPQGRPRAAGGPVHDRYEAAFLHGGPARVVDTALASLHADGRLAVGGPGMVTALPAAAPRDPVEQAVLEEIAAAPYGALHHLRLAVMRRPSVQRIGHGLAARGLVTEPSARNTTRVLCLVLGFLAFLLFPVSIVLSVMEAAAKEEPVAPFVLKVLPALIGVIVAAIACWAASAGAVTSAGWRALGAYGAAHGHLRDAGHLVALHGPGVLPDPVLRGQLVAAARMYGRGRPVPSSSGGGTSADEGAVWCAGGGYDGGGGSGGSSCGGGSGGGSSCGGGSGGGSSCGGGGGSSG
ncbi:TIGR04222 domain-containing membrane protein [Streptomyces sp.]|uniref:TIGR04222 domain-containing membrane protein n=1 Tax=Streptomyces sp. TaxID=1931 RepID=UPI0028121419|nr:TIGR04222 domain-containing membrane protein [Streptomyces sp.]